MKRIFTALTFLLVSAPAMAQTTNCHANVFGRPEHGVTCETQQQPQQRRPLYNGATLILEDNVAQQNAIMAQRRAQWQAQQQYELQQRELALRERELAFRQAQAMATPQ